MSYEKYLNIVSGNFKRAVKIEWLNPDETVNFEFTNSLYDIGVDLSVNYQNGSRRTCTITLNNDRNKFPVNFNNIWFGQKFKLWMGVYIDDATPFLFPQGVFYVSNPNDVFEPNTRTVKINGVDKWAFLDGTLHGKLSGVYQTNINTDLYDATRKLLNIPLGTPDKLITGNNIEDYFEKIDGDYFFEYNGSTFKTNNTRVAHSVATTTLVAKTNMVVSFKYSAWIYNTLNAEADEVSEFTIKTQREFDVIENIYPRGVTEKVFSYPSIYIKKGDKIIFSYYRNTNRGLYDDYCEFFDFYIGTSQGVIDPTLPFISPVFLNKTTLVDGKEVEVWKCPYTAKVERGKTYADVLLEYATILCAHIYYDVNGRLVIEPLIDTADDITDTNKEVVWHYTVEEKTLLGLTQTYNFDKVYNDIIVLGNIVNGYQFKARVQNRNLMSDTCVQKIGLKTKEPFEDNQYYSDEQCKELAMYYAKIDTILQKSGNISSTPLYHIDVNKLVSVSTPNNNMSKELFLITGYSLSASGTMSLNVTSVNILKDFSVVEVDVYE